MFACPHNVSQHVREKHTNERPYRCKICPDSRRGFNRPFTLNRHMEKLHGIKIGPGRGRGARRARGVIATTRTTMSSSDEETTASVEKTTSSGFNTVASTPRSTTLSLQTQRNEDNDDMMYYESQCKTCEGFFFDRNSVLMHHHTDHGEPLSPFCTCETCNSVYRGNDADLVELTQQFETGGFSVVDGVQHLTVVARSEMDHEVRLSDKSHHDLQELAFSGAAQPGDSGFIGMFADELFAAQTLDGVEGGSWDQDSVVCWANNTTNSNQLRDVDPQNVETCGGAIDYGSMEFEGLDFGDDDFGIDGFVGMTDTDMFEAI